MNQNPQFWLLILVCLSATLPAITSTHNFSPSNNRNDLRGRRNLKEAVTFDNAKKLANNVANLVHQRFEFDHASRFQFFIEASNMPSYGWDILKYKIAKKFVEGNSTFLMIFGGSSVTAGHDNYYNQSYPFVFERRMKPVFEALGIKLVVHNIAQGNNNCRPFLNCYESMGGPKADFIGWEQSFNCGKARDVFEQVARMAYWNEGVAYYSASGAFLPNACAPTTDKVSWTSEEWTPELEGITGRYEMTGEKVSAYRQLQMDWFCDGNSVSRFTSVYGGLYMGVGPHGFSVWGHSSTKCNNGTGCTAIDVKGDCHEKGGPHWMVQDTAWYAGDKNKKGKEWHPSAGMHLMRGEVLAYNYVHIVQDAILQVERNLTEGATKEQAAKYYQEQLDLLRVPIPEKALYVQAEESRVPPQCYTNYEPHFNPSQLLSRVVVGNHSGWSYQNRPPGGDFDHYGYKDTRPFYEAKGASLEIYVQLLGVRMGSCKVCGYSQKESLKHALFFFDPNITLTLNEPSTFSSASIEGVSVVAYTPSERRKPVPRRKYAGDECTQLFEIPNGNSVLTIRTDPEHPTHTSSLSHIVIF